MAQTKFSDIWTAQGSATIAVSAAMKILCEGATSNSGGIITPDALFTWLNTTKTLLTDAEVDALIAAALVTYTTMPNNYVHYTGMTFVETGGIRKGTLTSGLYCKDSTNAYDITVASGFCKYLSATFAAGTNNGGLDTGSFTTNRLYYIWAIRKSSTSDCDILYSLSNTAPSMPAGWDKKRLIGAVYYIVYYGGTEQFIQWTYNDINEIGKIKPKIPVGYIGNDMSITSSGVAVLFENVHVMDSTETYELHMPGQFQKLIDSVFVAGTGEGMNDIGALTDDTQYYLYIIKDPSTGAIDFLLDASSSSPSLPSGFTIYKLIGFLYNIDYATETYFVHTINEKWEDKNFDIANLAKIGETGAPGYEALFTADRNTIKVSTFADAAVTYIDCGSEYPHNGKNNFPFHFHAHGYAENTTAGNAVFFLDYIIASEGNDEATRAPIRLTKTVAMPGVKGEQFMINFDWIFPSSIAEGSQIWFTFGRLGTSGSDTYTGKVAVRTFGFHYLKDKLGSDLETTNI